MGVLLFLSLSTYDRGVDKWKKSFKYYNLSVRESLDIDIAPARFLRAAFINFLKSNYLQAILAVFFSKIPFYWNMYSLYNM